MFQQRNDKKIDGIAQKQANSAALEKSDGQIHGRGRTEIEERARL